MPKEKRVEKFLEYLEILKDLQGTTKQYLNMGNDYSDRINRTCDEIEKELGIDAQESKKAV